MDGDDSVFETVVNRLLTDDSDDSLFGMNNGFGYPIDFSLV